MWPKWIKKLNQINPKLYIEKPFIQLTTSEKKFEKPLHIMSFASNHLTCANPPTKCALLIFII